MAWLVWSLNWRERWCGLLKAHFITPILGIIFILTLNPNPNPNPYPNARPDLNLVRDVREAESLADAWHGLVR